MSKLLTSDRTNGLVSSPPRQARSASTPVRRHPLLRYYALTFAVSWGGILLVVGGPGGIPGTASDIQRFMPLAIPFMLFGPTIVALGLGMWLVVAGVARLPERAGLQTTP